MSDDGATPPELLLHACRRNNTSLLSDLLSSHSSSPSQSHIAALINTSTDPLGNHALHVAAGNGSYEVLDLLLDQEGVEVDPVEGREGDSPLHKAVRWVNGLGEGVWGGRNGKGGQGEAGGGVVELLLDAGADPRIRNKAKLKPAELVDPRNTELIATLQKAEFAMMAGDDVVGEEEEGVDPEGPTGSASDSE